MIVVYKILEYSIWWFPILCLSAPIIQTIIYYNWYVDYKKRKDAARWKRLEAFFAKNADKYPEAATSFGMAKFWASSQGYDTMHNIKKAEYQALKENG